MFAALVCRLCYNKHKEIHMIYIGSDHAGFALKESVKEYLDQKGIEYLDVGAHEYVPDDDYPDIGYDVAKQVVSSKEKARGILICGNAQGICIAANKVNGARAVTGYSEYAAKTSRQDDNANILCLAGRVLKPTQAKRIVGTWLRTPFSGAKRHERRLRRLKQLEQRGK